ncbi:conserved protein, unknown function, partial [Hepatocystis sp. ex Piliocolobus tephrosceles]
MVLLPTILNSQNTNGINSESQQKLLPNIKIIEEEYIECEINKKKKLWTLSKLKKEFNKYNHNIICLNKYKYYPFKKICQPEFSFLKNGEKYYTINNRMLKRDYKLIFENLTTSPSMQISFYGILVTAIV